MKNEPTYADLAIKHLEIAISMLESALREQAKHTNLPSLSLADAIDHTRAALTSLGVEDSDG